MKLTKWGDRLLAALKIATLVACLILAGWLEGNGF
jgi:hypothetical protein